MPGNKFRKWSMKVNVVYFEKTQKQTNQLQQLLFQGVQNNGNIFTTVIAFISAFLCEISLPCCIGLNQRSLLGGKPEENETTAKAKHSILAHPQVLLLACQCLLCGNATQHAVYTSLQKLCHQATAGWVCKLQIHKGSLESSADNRIRFQK